MFWEAWRLEHLCGPSRTLRVLERAQLVSSVMTRNMEGLNGISSYKKENRNHHQTKKLREVEVHTEEAIPGALPVSKES